jgi:hypothetical protein
VACSRPSLEFTGRPILSRDRLVHTGGTEFTPQFTRFAMEELFGEDVYMRRRTEDGESLLPKIR